MKAQRGLEKLMPMCARVPFGRCLCGRAANSGKTEYADRIDERHEIRYENISPHGHYCVPILSAGKLLGVINLYVKEGSPRDEKIEGVLNAVADILAGIIERKRTEEELQDSFEKLRKGLRGTIQALSMTVERRDPYTAGHQQRVANLARAIATEMGLPHEQIDAIRMTAAIHDIGKIAVPIEILSKPGRINDIEFSLIKTHAQMGYEILKDIDFPWPIAQIVLQHHERVNGTGYPSGLSGEDILIEARILAVADVIEAMATHRPYRAAYSIDKALEEISANKGTLFDPEVVAACLRLFAEKGFKL
jgi:putative nucleotidyltransferase with HDIG domain